MTSGRSHVRVSAVTRSHPAGNRSRVINLSLSRRTVVRLFCAFYSRLSIVYEYYSSMAEMSGYRYLIIILYSFELVNVFCWMI